MKDKSPVRFDLDTLRELAGGKTFARGEDYWRDGSVEITSLNAKRVVAQVAGTEDYRTVVTGQGTDIGGECSCPAFVDHGFCKHMVATALAANAGGAGAEAEEAGAELRIRQYLQSKGVDELVGMLLDLAEDDPALFRKLDMASAVAHADDKTLEARLRKTIDAATHTGTFVDYRQAQRWRTGVDNALDAIADLASGPRAPIALRLVEHALDRIGGAFESIDDSEGVLGGLLQSACDIHLIAARAAKPDPVTLARDLFKRETQGDFDIFAGALADYADVLGESGLAEYRRLATATWDTRHASPDRTRSAAEFSDLALKGILDFFAERDGNVEARIALRASNLSSPWGYLQLAEFCLSEGREAEALKRAEEGLWLFEDRRPDEQLLFFTVKLLTKMRRKADAEAHLWRAFEKAPSLGIYQQLRRIGDEAVAARAAAYLESRLANSKGGNGHERPDLLVELFMHEKRFDAAWSVVHKFGVSAHTKEALVVATESDYPREALAFYTAQVEHLAGFGAYAEAVKQIARMKKLRTPAEQAAFVADLRVRHGRKRNFMKLLD